jgi:hypothetical protein
VVTIHPKTIMSTLYGPLGQLQREAARIKYDLPADLADRDPDALDAMAGEFQVRVLRVHAPAMNGLADAVAELESAPTGTYDLKATTSTLPEPDATVYRNVQRWREDLYAGDFFFAIDNGLGAAGWRSPTMRQKYAMAIFDALTYSGWRSGGSLCRILTAALPVQPVPEARYYRQRALRVQYLEIAAEVIK